MVGFFVLNLLLMGKGDAYREVIEVRKLYVLCIRPMEKENYFKKSIMEVVL